MRHFAPCAIWYFALFFAPRYISYNSGLGPPSFPRKKGLCRSVCLVNQGIKTSSIMFEMKEQKFFCQKV